MKTTRLLSLALFGATLTASLWAQGAPSVRLLLPERTRLLQGQLFDIAIEVRNAAAVSGLKVTAGTVDLTSKFSAPVRKELDCDTTQDWFTRANLQSFDAAGDVKIDVSLIADGKTVTDSRTVTVREFNMVAGQRRNIILFIGDAMGTAYRDAARLVSRSIVDSTGKNAFREGFFDNLLEMDKMPVSGMSMTYGLDAVVPDSANTASAWSAGNKSFGGALNALVVDGNDCTWRYTGVLNTTTLPAMLDNPRVETLWQYLKRKYGYRAGIVSTAAITDATPAGEGAYSAYRQARLEIARQYRESPMLGGRPAFDVILGGGADPFTALGRAGADKRDLIAEFQGLGYRYVTTATQLKSVSYGQPTLGLFKGSLVPATASNGIATADVNMDVAYDKLKLQRPASEPVANLGVFTDQPMLDLMTEKAIEVLSQQYGGFPGQSPFILMVEGASIDKQSHPNNAAGTIWDTIELDKSIGVARAWAAKRAVKDTLIVVTADHDQSMSIVGVSNVPDAEYFDRAKSAKVSYTTPAGTSDFTVYGDSYSNVRAGYPYNNSSDVASNNGGTRLVPGSFPITAVPLAPENGTISTYDGLTAYKLDSATGYPVNSGAGLRRLTVGFRTGDHTGSAVPVTAEGPGALLFTGYMDQSDIFHKMATAVSSDTTDMDKALEALQSVKNPKTYGK